VDVIDADGAVLGRLAVQVADVLRGKTSPSHAHLDAGDLSLSSTPKGSCHRKKETARIMSYSAGKAERNTPPSPDCARPSEKLICTLSKYDSKTARQPVLTKLKVSRSETSACGQMPTRLPSPIIFCYGQNHTMNFLARTGKTAVARVRLPRQRQNHR